LDSLGVCCFFFFFFFLRVVFVFLLYCVAVVSCIDFLVSCFTCSYVLVLVLAAAAAAAAAAAV
jgi:hypothetical protein